MDIARERLVSQRLEGRPLKDVVDVVQWLVASQAQDFAGAKWALGARLRDADDAAVERAFARGAILRTHVLRPTWHFVVPDDIRWLLGLTAPRVHAANASRYRALGLDVATRKRAANVLGRALEGGRELTRDELREALERAGIETDGQRMAYALMHAELEAVICSGARRGKQFTYALLEERAPGARTLARADALVELAGRYIASRSPASAQDLAKWSGLTVAEARAGLEGVVPSSRRRETARTTYFSAGPKPRTRRGGPRAHLLSIYDEYISSYRDRSAIGDPADAQRLINQGNALAYVFLLDGRIAGTWKRTFEKRTARVRLTAFRRLGAGQRRAVAVEAARFMKFVDPVLELDLAITP